MACRKNLIACVLFWSCIFAHIISQSLFKSGWLEDTMSFRTSTITPSPAVVRSLRYAFSFWEYFTGLYVIVEPGFRTTDDVWFYIVCRCFKVGFFVYHTTTIYGHNTQVLLCEVKCRWACSGAGGFHFVGGAWRIIGSSCWILWHVLVCWDC